LIDHTIQKANVIQHNSELEATRTNRPTAQREYRNHTSPDRHAPLPFHKTPYRSSPVIVSSRHGPSSSRHHLPNYHSSSRRQPPDKFEQQVSIMDFSNLDSLGGYHADLPVPVDKFIKLMHLLKGKCPRCWLIGLPYSHKLDDCSASQANRYDDHYLLWRRGLSLEKKTCFKCLGSQVRVSLSLSLDFINKYSNSRKLGTISTAHRLLTAS
jgi:hypothetical protein